MVRRAARWTAAIGLVAVGGLVGGLAPSPAAADIIDFPAPSSGCLDSVGGATGFFENVVDPAGGITLDVPGPVAQVIVEWMGEFVADPADAGLGLTVTEPDTSVNVGVLAGTPSAKDSVNADGVSSPFTYGFWDDATSLFGAGASGTYAVEFAPPPDGLAGRNHWWGATITVVYDTTPCGQIADFIWKIGADYYFGGAIGPPTTDLIVYAFAQPLTEDLVATVRASHGGADSSAVGDCRVSVVWVGTGDGTAPTVDDDLVDLDGNPVYPGAAPGVLYPFSPGPQSCPAATVNAPVQEVRGGNVGTEYALIEMDILIPAGSTWLAFQLESPRDNNGFLPTRPESGGWGGGGLLLIPAIGEPSISLEKTVLDGAGGTCPGVEGTDENVTVDVGVPVTYCFRVVNDGQTSLFPVTIDDATLGIDESDLTVVTGDPTVPLLIGGELVFSYETTAGSDLTNVATAVGDPVDGDGNDIVDLANVEDTNDASVEVVLPPTTTTAPTTAAPTTAAPTTTAPTTTAPTTTTVDVTTTAAPATTTAPVTTVSPILPDTGRNNGPLAVTSLALLVAGVGIVVVTRRRPTSS